MKSRGLAESLFVAGLALGASPAFSQDDLAAREQAANQTVMSFAKELSGALKVELKKGGPSSAIGVCRDIAPGIANRISLKKGWKVTRVGTRVRNAMIGTPDAREQQVLAEFQARPVPQQSSSKRHSASAASFSSTTRSGATSPTTSTTPKLRIRLYT